MPGQRRRKYTQESESSDDDDVSESSESNVSDADSDSEKVFCKCGQGNTKDMIGCDGQDCRYEWFHFRCVGIDPKRIPRGKWLCEDCQNMKDKEELKCAPPGQYVLPVSNPVPDPIKTQATTVKEANNSSCGAVAQEVSKPVLTSDVTMTESLSVAEKKHAINLKRACNAVLWDGRTVASVAKQYKVGRYVLADYVKDQVEISLNSACQDVINKKYTMERAAKVYRIAFKILADRVEAKKNAVPTGAELKAPVQSVEDCSLEKNLHFACMDIMSSRCTLMEASKIYKIKASTIESKLRTALVLTTEEEDELVQMCLNMSKDGQSSQIKNAVILKVKALLDDEERRGIKRVHAFPYNMPDTFWWETFCSLHPEVKVKELQPKPSVSSADKVYYILPTPKDNNSKFLLVKQNSQPANQVPPAIVSGVVSSAQPSASHQPVSTGNSSNLNHGNQQNSDTSLNTNSLPVGLLPNPEATVGGQDNELSPGATAAGLDEQNCTEVSEKVAEGTGVTSFVASGTEESVLIHGKNPVTTPSVSIADNEVQHPDRTATNEAARSDAVITDDDIPDIKLALLPDTSNFTDQAQGKETAQASEAVGTIQVGQINQNVVRVVVDSSSTADNNTRTDLVAGSTETSILDANKTPKLMAVMPNPVTQPVPALNTQSTHMVSQPNSVILQIKPLSMQPNTVIGRPSLVRTQLGPASLQSKLADGSVLINQVTVPAGCNYASIASKDSPKVIIVENHKPPPHKQIFFTGNDSNKNQVICSTQPFNLNPAPQPVNEASKPILDSSSVCIVLPSPPEKVFPCTSQVNNIGQSAQGPQKTSNISRADLKKSFIPKNKIDKSIPDALTCLEKTLSEEQKASFAFRLQIGDDRRDDALFNAWKALKRLYHHAGIYSMYDKVDPHPENSSQIFDLPVACKLLELPFMDPTKHDQKLVKDPTRTEQSSQILAELCRGRKRRMISSKLAQREENKRRPPKKARKFLEPWKFEMKKPNKRKSFISTCLNETLINLSPDDEDYKEEETDIQNPLENPGLHELGT